MPPDSPARTVTFRLTSEEHRRFRQLGFIRSRRNVTERAHPAVHHAPTKPEPFHPAVHSVECRVPVGKTRNSLILKARRTARTPLKPIPAHP